MTLEQLLRDARNLGRQGPTGASQEQRISALERTLAAVATQPPAADTLQPSYLSFQNGIAGLATYPAGDIPNNVNGTPVEWVRQADGSVVAQLLGQVDNAGRHKLLAASQAIGPTDQNYVDVAALDDLGSLRSFVEVSQSARGGGPANTNYVLAGAGGHEIQVLAGDGTTSFLQLAAEGLIGSLTADAKIAIGNVIVTWPGGTLLSNTATITGPPWVNNTLAWCTGTFGGAHVSGLIWEVEFAGGNPGTWNIHALSNGPVGSANTSEAYWIAIGW